MISYVTAYEIKVSLKELIKEYLKDCRKSGQLTSEFNELIRHHFKAKYGYYDQANDIIEIGINQSSEDSFYPDIQVFTFSLKKLQKEFENSLGESKDLNFYGKFLSRNKKNVVVIS